MAASVHVDFGCADVWYEAPDLIKVSIKSDETLDVETSKRIRQWIFDQGCKIPYKLLTVPQPRANVSPEIRNYLSDPERVNTVKADAMVVDNFPHRLLADFYLRFNRPSVATRLFLNEEAARNWLSNI